MPFVDIQNCNVFYKKAGTGAPVLLFVHGGFCDHRDWQHQFDALKDSFTIVTIDQRCHGSSVVSYSSCTVKRFASDVHDIIDALDLGPTVVVGHSLGARVTIQAVADRPEHLLGAVLVDGSRLAMGTSPEDVNQVEAQRFGDDPGKYLADRFESMFFENADPDVKARVVSTAASTPPAAIEAIASATGLWDALGIDSALGAIPPTFPVLAIQSTFHDHKQARISLEPGTITTPWLDYLRRYIPHLEVGIVPSVGHFNMLEAPDQVSTAIKTFAEKWGGRPFGASEASVSNVK
ncbi:alpha/beta fold hydrolase [Paraburkholderia sp. GAS32]|uniref:alpha/beta fold hydrolase n=1 Tax=Paraburkholderia sp. GAS32 TaxID=3035129 RepID=UPI003D2534CA